MGDGRRLSGAGRRRSVRSSSTRWCPERIVEREVAADLVLAVIRTVFSGEYLRVATAVHRLVYRRSKPRLAYFANTACEPIPDSVPLPDHRAFGLKYLVPGLV